MSAAVPDAHEDEAALASKREIVSYLVHVHMLALQLFKCEQRHYTKQSAAGEYFYKSLTEKEREMAERLDEEREIFEEQNSWQDDGTWTRPGVFDVPVPMQSMDALGLNDLGLILSNAKPNAFYDYFLFAQSRLFKLSKKLLTEVDGKSSYWVSGAWIEIRDVTQLRLEANNNMQQLICVLETLQSLRGCVGRAAGLLHLTKDDLLALKLKLTAFDTDSQYKSAISNIPFALEPQQSLVYGQRKDWW